KWKIMKHKYNSRDLISALDDNQISLTLFSDHLSYSRGYLLQVVRNTLPWTHNLDKLTHHLIHGDLADEIKSNTPVYKKADVAYSISKDGNDVDVIDIDIKIRYESHKKIPAEEIEKHIETIKNRLRQTPF